MGDPACWIDQVCEGCSRVAHDLDEDRRCETCQPPNSGQADQDHGGDGEHEPSDLMPQESFVEDDSGQ